MTLDDFTDSISFKSSPVILLEGSRIVAEADKPKMIALGEKLASMFPNAVFRSGNAAGSDSFFAKGVSQVNPLQLELVLPNKRRIKSANGEKRISLEDLSDTEIKDVCEITKSATPINKSLIEYYEKGFQGSPRIKAQYLLRDTLKIIGSKRLDFKPADFGIFYLNSTKKTGGGTGHTIRVCELQNVPVLLQESWLSW